VQNPDFQKACRKCLQNAFYKKKEADIIAEVDKELFLKDQEFQKVKREFGVVNNIKEDFCTFSSNRITRFLKSFDESINELKQKFTAKFQRELLAETEKIERFH